MFGAILVVGGATLWQAQAILRADLASADARPQVLAWASGASAPASPRTWGVARDALLTSLAITPDDPDLQERMGDLWLAAGQRDWRSNALRRDDFRQAAGYYQSALRLRPTEPQTWAMLALSRQAMDDRGARVHDPWARASALGPYEGNVLPILMQIVLADWAGATPGMRLWATRFFDGSDTAARNGINAMAARYGLHFDPDAPAS